MGGKLVDQTDIVQEVEQYYNSLFSTSYPTNLECILSHVSVSINDSINQKLIKDVDDEEIKTAVFDMHPLKAPGADGMTPLFFQTYWNILSKEICDAIKSIFSTGYLLPEWNHTLITLVPKVKSPTLVSQFRPISLCSTFYKIIAKNFGCKNERFSN